MSSYIHFIGETQKRKSSEQLERKDKLFIQKKKWLTGDISYKNGTIRQWKKIFQVFRENNNHLKIYM